MSNLEQALKVNLFEELDLLPAEFEEYTFSEEYEKYIKRLFDKMRGDKMHRFTKKTATVILIAAILFALIIVGFAATAGRDFIIKTFSDHFEYSITDKSKGKRVTDLQIGYIPEGFELEKEVNEKDTYIMVYYTNGNKHFYIEKYMITASAGFTIDRQAEFFEKDGITYVYYGDKKYGVNGYVWNNGEYLIQVDGNMSKEEILEIALQVN